MVQKTNRTISKIICLSLLAGVILFSCQTDVFNEIETSEVSNNFSVSDAKNWFETTGQNFAALRSASGESSTPVLNWDVAEMSNNAEWEVVELPWEYENTVQIFALREVWQHALATNTVPENITRLVVMQHRVTGATYGFKMRIAPTLDFLLNNNESLHGNTYLHRDSRLSGIVMFYTLGGLFVNGWGYRDGEIIAEFASKRAIVVEDMNAPTTRSSSGGGCIPFCGFEGRPCFCFNSGNSPSQPVDDPNLEAGGGDRPPLMTIPPGQGGIPPLTVPPPHSPGTPNLPGGWTPNPPAPNPPAPPSPPGSSTPNPPGGWTGGGNTSTPAPPSGSGSGGVPAGGANTGAIMQPSPLLSSIFNVINAADVPLIEEMLREILEDCMGKELLRRIANNLGPNERLPFKFIAGAGSSHDPNTGQVRIGREASSMSASLLHELFHVFQRQENRGNHPTETSWNNLAMNREIEAWLAHYLFLSRSTNPDNFTALVLDFYNDPSLGQSIVELGQFITPRGTVRSGQHQRLRESLTDITEPQFRAHSSYEELRFTRPEQPASWTMFDSIRDLSSNC